MDDKIIREQLKDIRKARGLTLEKLAQKAGLEQQQVSRIERGERKLTLNYLLKISDALEIPVNEIVNFTSNKSMITRGKEMEQQNYDEVLENMMHNLERINVLFEKFKPSITFEEKKHYITQLMSMPNLIKDNNLKKFFDKFFDILEEILEKLDLKN